MFTLIDSYFKRWRDSEMISKFLGYYNKVIKHSYSFPYKSKERELWRDIGRAIFSIALDF